MRVLGVGGDAGQAARDAAAHVDRREAAALGDAAVEDDVAVEDAAGDVGDRLVHVGGGDEHREDGGDVALAEGAGAGALAERGDEVRGRGREAAQARRLAGGEGDLAVGLGEAGERVEEEEDVAALVAEDLGHRHRHPGGAALDQRRLVGGGGDDDGAGHALGAEDVVDEVAQLAAALADQGIDDDLGLDAAGEVGEERGLADAGAGEDADALAAGDGQDGVEDGEAGREAGAEALAGGGRRRGAAEGGAGGAGVSGRPSRGWPKASTMRPTQASAGWTPAGPRRVAASPTAAPSSGA